MPFKELSDKKDHSFLLWKVLAIEHDKYDPSLDLAFKLAKILKTNVQDLFMFEDDGIES